MKALRISALLLFALCFSLAGATRASAQSVVGFSDIWYDDQTGIVTAYGETDIFADPFYQVYGAAVFVQMTINGEDGPGAYDESCCSGTAAADVSVYAADYGYDYFQVTSTHTVIIDGSDPLGLSLLDWQDSYNDSFDFLGSGGGGDCLESGGYCEPPQYCGPIDLGTTQDAISVTPIPHIDGITPSGGSAGTRISTTLRGSNLDIVTSLNIGGGITASIDFQGFDILGATVTIPTSASGGYSLTAVSPYGTSNAVTFTIEDTTPVITGIDPTVWEAGATTTVTFTGQHFGTNAPTLGFSPSPGISYTLSSYNDTEIVADVSVATGTPNEDVSVTVTSNGYSGSPFRPGASGSSPTSSPAHAMVHAPISSPRVTIIAWINANAPDLVNLPSGANPTLMGKLTVGALSCVVELTAWSAGISKDLHGSADTAYANAWLIKHSGNAEPPPTIDQTTQLNGGDYRLFNDFRGNSQGFCKVGITPDPCKTTSFIPGRLEEGEASSYNGSNTSRSGKMYQLVEGRLGEVGQLISFTINGRTVPWIFDVIEFDLTGTETTTISATFPTYSVYQNGIRTAVYPQSSVAEFATKDQCYQLTPSDIP